MATEFRETAKLAPIKPTKFFKGKPLQLLTTRPQNKNISLWFKEIADCLLNKVHLVVNGAHYRFVEIEFYYQNSSDHCDPSVHCDPLQKTNEKWYFHRSGGTYKGGTFKGLDITFAENDVFGGIIIRGIENEHGDVIDGPCLCVDHILQKTNCSTVAELDKRVSDYSVWDAKSPLYIKTSDECDKREIIASPRVGLTLAYRDKAAQMSEYIMKNYRYLSTPRKTKKGKVYMILALHAQGKISEEIRDAVGSTKKAIGSYIGFFQEGQKHQDFSAYIGKKLDTKLTAQLYGTWWEIFGKQQSS